MPLAPEYLHLVHQGPFPCYLYGRNSRDPKKKGRSVGDQLHEGHAIATTHNWPIVGEFKDTGISATRHAKKARDDFEDMLDGIRRRECRIVVAFEASRYYRDLEAYVRLRKACHEAGVFLCYNGQVFDLSDPADRKATAQDALQAEAEGEDIRNRNLRTVRLNAHKGRPHGPLLDGYKRRYDPDTGDLIDQIIDPKRGPIIAGIWTSAAAGVPLGQIRAQLKQDKHRTHKGKDFEEHHLRYILRNPGYLGHRVFQGEDIGEAIWPALTDEETFEQVQAILDMPGRAWSEDTAVRHLLSGVGLCGEHPELRGPGHEEPVLRPFVNRTFPSLRCELGAHVTINEAKADAYVEEAVIDYLASKASEAAFDPPGGVDERMKAARATLKVLTTQLEEAQEAAGRIGPNGPELSVTSLARLEASLLPQIAAAREAAHPQVIPEAVRGLLGNPRAESMWEGLLLEQRRLVLRTVVTIRLNKASRPGIRTIEPGRISLSFYGQPGFKAIRRRARATAPPPAGPRARPSGT
ncbi:recombinase family protein [Streptomyces sp. NPDC006422]|uniref:recombinase family protein n=1 Tax=unclassified Streptomyces TaxID=2593676 RepID=UPI0033B0052F